MKKRFTEEQIIGFPKQAASAHRTAGVIAMLPRLVVAEHRAGHTLWLRFADGVEGEVDLRDELDGEIFEPLRDEGKRPTTTVLPTLR